MRGSSRGSAAVRRTGCFALAQRWRSVTNVGGHGRVVWVNLDFAPACNRNRRRLRDRAAAQQEAFRVLVDSRPDRGNGNIDGCGQMDARESWTGR